MNVFTVYLELSNAYTLLWEAHPKIPDISICLSLQKWSAPCFAFVAAFRWISASRLIDPGSHNHPKSDKKPPAVTRSISRVDVPDHRPNLCPDKGKSSKSNQFYENAGLSARFQTHPFQHLLKMFQTNADRFLPCCPPEKNKIHYKFTTYETISSLSKTPGAGWHSNPFCYSPITLLHKLC